MRYVMALALVALAGCGSRGQLKPVEGASLPQKPYGATATPTPEQLLTPGAQARPERSDELLRTSQPRSSDEFDLPPRR